MVLSRRDFLKVTPLVGGAFSFQRFLAAAEGPMPVVGRSTQTTVTSSSVPLIVTRSNRLARILQCTDLHFFGQNEGEDERTLTDLKQLIERFEPDLLAITGDLWNGNSERHGQRRLEFAAHQLASFGMPWSFCWGDDDLLDDYQRGHEILEKARGSLYRGTFTHGHHRIEIAAPRDRLTAAIDLLFLNSGTDGLADWSLSWLQATALELAIQRKRSVPAFVFFHIPILEYQTLYQPGFGVRLEKVSFEKESGAALTALSRPGSIRACFCGHNHLNDYVVHAGPVDLHYGRATGHGGYGGLQLRKGAKLIEIDLRSAEYEAFSVFADGKRWRADLRSP